MENNKLQVILSYRTRKQTRTVITNWTRYTCQQTRCLLVQNILLLGTKVMGFNLDRLILPPRVVFSYMVSLVSLNKNHGL